MKAPAYLNFGRWVVDCPADGCRDAREVYERHPTTGELTGRRLTEDICAKGHRFQIEMPDERTEAQIVTVLSERIEDADKGWYPEGHERGILSGQPTGQTIADLRAENAEVARFRARQSEATQEQLREALAAAGIEVRADGTFEGAL